MAQSFVGSILHVDLTESRLWVEHPEEKFYRDYGGGSAMGLHYILKEMPTGVDPLSPQNILTVFSGVPTGLAISGQSRVSVNARSPLTNAIGDSQGGGFFPAALKFAGLDGIVINGKADHPVYLLLEDGKAEIRDAGHIWGKMTAETEEIIKKELDDRRIEVMQIGPAGERLVRFAAVMNMHTRANGRTGMGAVMGSKLLKAIVVRGNRRIEPFDKGTIVALNKEGIKNLEEIPDVKGLYLNGTGDVVPFQNSIGCLPTRNYREGQFTDFSDISGETVTRKILTERETCFGCVVRCKRVVETEFEGRKVLPTYGGAEYETLATFGSYCKNNDLASIQYVNQLCNAYGMDTISCGATIAFAMDCYEKGLLTLADTGGLDLRFGNKEAVVEMTERIARREGLGDLLAEGSARAADKIGHGATDLLATCKGQEIPAHAPQAKRSLGLIYAVNPFGADHQSSEHDPMYEEGGAPLYFERLAMIGLNNPQTPGSMGDEKVRFAYLTEVFYSALDSYGLCQFVWGPAWTLYGPAEMASMLRAATGWDVDISELLRVGERRLNLMRAFNMREGFTRADDSLPVKFSNPLEGEGPTSGIVLDPAHLEHEKDTYYRLAGWDMKSGNPTRERLKELGLEWIQA
jgi:aldehyde:ferredoxin oxidoreductase